MYTLDETRCFVRSKQVGPADPSLSGLSADDRSTILGHSAPDPRVLKNHSKIAETSLSEVSFFRMQYQETYK